MNISDHMKKVARETLDVFAKVANAAGAFLRAPPPSSNKSIINPPNQLVHPDPKTNPLVHLRRNTDRLREACKVLCQEPILARVKTVDEDGFEETYYISRFIPPNFSSIGTLQIASYGSPRGRLASPKPDVDSQAGEERTLEIDGATKTVKILEYARYQPALENGEWDAKGIFLENLSCTIPFGSLRLDILQAGVARAPDTIDEQLRRAKEEESARENRRRKLIDKMHLRDQPILNYYQDEIFRLPLNSRLLIRGAPGTGKTTTLIKRIGQKLDVQLLDEAEKAALGGNTHTDESDHDKNWIMFAPTKLLKFYVKEAFNRENIPAPNDRIHTWSEFRHKLARETFEVLKTSSGKSRYAMNEDVRTLQSTTKTDQIKWFEDFDQWQNSLFWENMHEPAKILSKASAPDVASFGADIIKVLAESDKTVQHTLVPLSVLADEMRPSLKSMKAETDNQIRSALHRQANKNLEFLKELAEFIKSLTDISDDSDEQDIEEDTDDTTQPRTGLLAAEATYNRAIRAQARAVARDRSISKTSRSGQVLEWIGDLPLTEQALCDMGASIEIQSALRKFVNLARLYINRMPARYQLFRRTRSKEEHWYTTKGFNRGDVHPLEVDVILLAMMRSSNDLFGNARRIKDGNHAQTVIDRISGLHRTQVLVDEATDFSPLQLAAMYALAHPRTRSFFACGDFNQRITNWGVRSKGDVQWAVPGIDIRKIKVAYRQSSQLHNLAGEIAKIFGDSIEDVYLPRNMDNHGVPPVRALQKTDKVEIAQWIADRIQEIENIVSPNLPPIAVLMHTEDEVQGMAKALKDKLIDQNIPVTACPGGDVPPSQDGAVFVFAVQHIKGLEFEAAFFVGIDKLAETQRDLFGKYLYVGATRAATYFGITCEGAELPAKMAGLRKLFKDNWQDGPE